MDSSVNDPAAALKPLSGFHRLRRAANEFRPAKRKSPGLSADHAARRNSHPPLAKSNAAAQSGTVRSVQTMSRKAGKPDEGPSDEYFVGCNVPSAVSGHGHSCAGAPASKRSRMSVVYSITGNTTPLLTWCAGRGVSGLLFAVARPVTESIHLPPSSFCLVRIQSSGNPPIGFA